MVAVIKTGRSSAQATFSVTNDNIIQAKEALFALKNRMVARGWTVTFSCGLNNGAGRAANSSDNWVVATDLEFAAAASNHSHVTLRAPVTKGRPAGADRYYLIIDCISTGTAAQVQPVNWYLARNAPTGGSATARQTATSELPVLTTNIIPWTTSVAARYGYCDTDDGDMIFGVKVDGAAHFRSCIILQDDPDWARGNYILWFYANHSPTAISCFGSADLANVANVRTFMGDGSAPAATTSRPGANCSIWNMSATGGIEPDTSNIPARGIALYASGNAIMRDFGRLVDVAGVGGNVVYNAVFDNDQVDPIRHRACGGIANTGGLMLPVLRSMGAWG